MSIKLSVIVPVYNVELYLKECIDSILNQTFTDFELILVNDGSPDNCGNICDEYAAKDDRVRVIHKKNGGISSARNAGLDVANGDYIAYLDSDDYIAADMFEQMLNVAINTNADVVKCGFNEFDEKSIKKTAGFSKLEIFENDSSGCNLLHLYFNSVLFIVVWNAIYKRDLALKVRFPEGLINEDNYSAGLYLFHAKKIVCMDKEFYFYRDVAGGLSKVGRTKKQLDVVVVTAKLHEYLLEKGAKNDDFFLKLEDKIARGIYHSIRGSGRDGFRLCSMDEGFFDFVVSRLSFSRKMRMMYYKLIRRFEVK